MKTPDYSLLFRDLSVNSIFIFSGERLKFNLSVPRGPWQKVSMWKYKHMQTGQEHKVKSLRARVAVINPMYSQVRLSK